MSINFEVSDTLEPLKHTATALQLFRYSAVTWNPHRIHFDEPYAREEGHRGLGAALPPPGGAGLALRYRGPRPPVAGHEVRLPPAQARVRAGRSRLHRAGDRDRRSDTMTLELTEQHPSGEAGFEGTVWVSKTTEGATK